MRLWMQYKRIQSAAYLSRELAWFSNEDETVLGILLLDTIDNDYASIVLGCDESGRFRAINVESSFPDKDSAVNWLHNIIKWHTCNSPAVFPQVDKSESLGLFTPIVPPEKQHVYFRRLISDTAFIPAREIIKRIMHLCLFKRGRSVPQT